MHFSYFFKVKVQNGKFWGVAKISNIIFWCLIFLIFVGVKSKCWAEAYVWRKIESKQKVWSLLRAQEACRQRKKYMHTQLVNASHFTNKLGFCPEIQ